MNRKLILIGPKLDKSSLKFSGQSMMFQMFLDDIMLKGISYFVIDISEKNNYTRNRKSGEFSLNRLFEYLENIAYYFKVIIKNKNSIIYITISQSKIGFLRDLYFIRLAYLFNCKIIAHQFGGNFGSFYFNQSSFLKKKIKNLYKRVDLIIVEGEYSRQNFSFLENKLSNVISLPNGLPEKVSIDYKNKLFDSKSTFNILYLSNLIFTKGYFDLLMAIDLLVNKFNVNVSCSFVGKFLGSVDDPLNCNVEKMKGIFFEYIKEKRLTNFVTYSESKSGIDKKNEFLKAHVFVLPSYYLNEGQPVSVLEAIAYGVVPILTDYRLMPQMVGENAGFFVEAKNPVSIAHAILYLINNPESYTSYSRNAMKHFNEKFTSELYLEKLYKCVTNNEK